MARSARISLAWLPATLSVLLAVSAAAQDQADKFNAPLDEFLAPVRPR